MEYEEGKMLILPRRNLVGIALAKWSAFTSPVVSHIRSTYCVMWCDEVTSPKPTTPVSLWEKHQTNSKYLTKTPQNCLGNKNKERPSKAEEAKDRWQLNGPLEQYKRTLVKKKTSEMWKKSIVQLMSMDKYTITM